MAREIGFWKKSGTYITPVFTGGVDILVRGANRYINFDADSGEAGYGIRDNAGTIEIKSFGGSWGAVATGGSPAGTDTHIQFNNSGSFGATEQTNDAVRWMEDTGDYTFLVGKSAGSNAKMEIQNLDAASTRGNLRIISASDAGGDYDIRIDSPDPDIEFINTDQTSPAGDFEIGVPSGNDFFGISGRNAGNTSFETAFQVHRKASGAMVGINVNYSTPEAMLEIVPSGSLDLIHLSNAVATSGDIMKVDQSGNQFLAGALNLGHASDTTISRTSAGNIAVEGNTIYRAGGTDVSVADGGTGRSTSTTAYGLIAAGTTATGPHQTLATGATTQILVGAGASALPVWTTATGSGAPVRATSPTLVTPVLGAATGTSLSLGGAVVPTVSSTSTLTNKRITRRVTATASSSTPTPDISTTDQYNLTALATNATFGSPTGTPVAGDRLIIRIKDDGTIRTLAWNAIYRAIGVTLPTTTVASKTLYVGFIYNSTDSKWDCIASAQEA